MGEKREPKDQCGDDLIVYGAQCVWWDSIDKAGTLPGPHSLPCCPHCKSVLLQMDRKQWFDALHEYAKNNPGYENAMRWSRGRCFATMESLMKSYGGRRA